MPFQSKIDPDILCASVIILSSFLTGIGLNFVLFEQNTFLAEYMRNH